LENLGEVMIIVIIVIIISAVLQGKKLAAHRDWKELLVFGILVMAGTTLSILKVINVDIPDPVEGLKNFIDILK